MHPGRVRRVTTIAIVPGSAIRPRNGELWVWLGPSVIAQKLLVLRNKSIQGHDALYRLPAPTAIPMLPGWDEPCESV